jgi:SET domain-containing protein
MPGIFLRATDPMDRQLNDHLLVAESEIHGFGLFATVALVAGQFIGIYQGPETTEDGTHVLWIEGDTADEWIGYDGKNDLRFMNHSISPNAEMDGLNCYALSNIETGTEITIDYGWDES